MNIKQRLDGKYTVSYTKRHEITRQPISMRRTGLESKSEARRAYAELVMLVNDKIKQQIVPKWLPFMEEYFQKGKSLGRFSDTTAYNQEKVLKKQTAAWSEKLVDQISTEDIYGLMDKNLKASAEAHRKFFIKCVKGVFDFALEKGYIGRNPTPRLTFKLNDKIMGVLNETQIVQLLNRCQELNWPWYPHYALALFTGMRNGELYALTWDKVKLEERQILVNCSWNNRDGIKSTKSGDDRIVEIPKPLLPVLIDLKENHDGGSFVLPRMSKWDKGEQARELRFMLKSLGLPEIRFHDLRASWATLLLGKGVPASKVMSMGGWKDMDTMMIYMRKAGINIKDATNVLDGIEVHSGVVQKEAPCSIS